jgi:copper chaperone CopZ
MSKTIDLKVVGMHCIACANVITRTLSKQPGVNTAEVNYETATANISFDETITTTETLAKSIESLGYAFVMPAVYNNL